jgi:hypothetical protein
MGMSKGLLRLKLLLGTVTYEYGNAIEQKDDKK